MTPIIIPLSKDESGKYIELRFCLRSIARHYKHKSPYYPIVIVGSECPSWLNTDELTFIHKDDSDTFKDTNMVRKILTGIAHLVAEGLPENSRFTKFSDDYILLGDYYSESEYPKYFCPMSATYDRLFQGYWKDQFGRTLDFLKEQGCTIPLNYDTHTPQPCQMDDFVDVMKQIDYNEAGYVINSVYHNLSRAFDDRIMGDRLKAQITVDPGCQYRLAAIESPPESMKAVHQAVHNCRYLQTNNKAFSKGRAFVKYLKKRFPKKSWWEN